MTPILHKIVHLCCQWLLAPTEENSHITKSSHTTHWYMTTEASFLLPLFIHIDSNPNVSF